MMMSRLVSSLAFASALLAGCATNAPLPTNYAPSSTLSAKGSLSVGEFAYLPADRSPPVAVEKKAKNWNEVPTAAQTVEEATGQRNGSIAPNQIRNSAMGQILIDRPVKVYVRDAVLLELRFVGMNVNDAGRVLRGDIEEFFVDDLGYSVDWQLRIRYELRDGAGKLLFRDTKENKRKTAKFANPFGALNETVKLNVEELLRDPDFLAAVG